MRPSFLQFLADAFMIVLLLAVAFLILEPGCNSDNESPGHGSSEDSKGFGEEAPWRVVPKQIFEPHPPGLVIGLPGNGARALFNADGSVRVDPEAPALRLWIYNGNSKTLAHPSKGEATMALTEGYLPLPKVRWPAGSGVEAEAEFFALLKSGVLPQAEEDTFYKLNVRLFNNGDAPCPVKVMVGIIPKPRGDVSAPAGKITLEDLAVKWKGESFLGLPRLPDFFGTAPFKEGIRERELFWHGESSEGTGRNHGGAASMAVCGFDLKLGAPGGDFAQAACVGELQFVLPAPGGGLLISAEEARRRALQTRIYWMTRSGLDKPEFTLPNRIYVDAFRSAVITLLVAWRGAHSQASPADTALAAVALNRAGQFTAARGFLAQLLDSQQEDGTVPDETGKSYSFRSNGLAIYALSDHFEFTQDRDWLDMVYPCALRAADRLKVQVSEGARLYYEDSWAIHAFRSMARLAQSAGKQEQASSYQAEADALKTAFDESIGELTRRDKIFYIPHGKDGSLDPESLPDQAALLWPEPVLDPRLKLTRRSFEHYWKVGFEPNFSRIEPPEDGSSFATAGIEMAWPLILLKERQKVFELFDWLMQHQAVPGTFTWSDRWPVDEEAGDEDSSWRPSVRIAAAYVIAFRMLFVHEREDALVLGQGLLEKWFDRQDTYGVIDAPTRFGAITYGLNVHDRVSLLSLDTSAAPPKGFALSELLPSIEPTAAIDGRKVNVESHFRRWREIGFPPGTLTVKVEW